MGKSPEPRTQGRLDGYKTAAVGEEDQLRLALFTIQRRGEREPRLAVPESRNAPQRNTSNPSAIGAEAETTKLIAMKQRGQCVGRFIPNEQLPIFAGGNDSFA